MSVDSLRLYLKDLKDERRQSHAAFQIGATKLQLSMIVNVVGLLIVLLSQTFAPKPLLSGRLFVVIVGIFAFGFIAYASFVYGRKLKIDGEITKVKARLKLETGGTVNDR